MLDIFKKMKKRAAISRAEAFKAEFDGIVKAFGFQKSATTWTHEDGNIVLILNLQKSQWGEQFYINTGIHFKGFQDKKDKAHISARYESLLGDSSLPQVIDFEKPRMDYSHVYDTIKNRVIPLLMTLKSSEELRKFVIKYNRKRVLVSAEAREFLKVQL